MTQKLRWRIHNHKFVIPLVAGFMFMAMSGSVGAVKTYIERQLKGGSGGFKRLADEEIKHMITNRTILWRHNEDHKVKIWIFYYQDGNHYLKILGNKKYEGKIHKSTHEIKDDRLYSMSIVNGERINDRFYSNGEIMWMCGGRKHNCSYYSKVLKESWDGDSENLKK